jgi:hypothetical protein
MSFLFSVMPLRMIIPFRGHRRGSLWQGGLLSACDFKNRPNLSGSSYVRVSTGILRVLQVKHNNFMRFSAFSGLLQRRDRQISPTA